MNELVILAAAAYAGAIFCLVIGALWDSTTPSSGLNADTGGTSQRRGPHGDPWRTR
jgi:hypothetical protein